MTTYQFKNLSTSQMDELHAQLYRMGLDTTPDFNKKTLTTKEKISPKFLKVIKFKKGKK